MNKRDYAYEAQVVKRLASMSRGEVADLRRSLSHPPGEFVPAMRVLEHFFNQSEWRRIPTYVVGGLFADIWRPQTEDTTWSDADTRLSLPRTMRAYIGRRGTDARGPLERRFLTLIDTSLDGVAVHMRPLLRMVHAEGLTLSWTRLLYDVTRWSSPDSRIQLSWAREFYRTYDDSEETDELTNESEPNTSIITK
jgi:CRISPR type I-E-associated protein CasB/Cse2